MDSAEFLNSKFLFSNMRFFTVRGCCLVYDKWLRTSSRGCVVVKEQLKEYNDWHLIYTGLNFSSLSVNTVNSEFRLVNF